MMKQGNWARACLPALALVLAMSAAPSPVSAQVYLDSLGEPEAEAQEPGLSPDAVPKGEPPPYSAQERKGDRLDPRVGDAPLLKPLDRPKLLAELYERLGAAATPQAAKPVMAAIEELWRMSGSDTADLLVSRAERFIQEADLDLAQKILDAAGDIAPEDAEIWYQRARVYALQRKYERAAADLRRALLIDPRHYGALNELGVVQQELGSKKEALESYRKALAVNPFLDHARRAAMALASEVEGQEL